MSQQREHSETARPFLEPQVELCVPRVEKSSLLLDPGACGSSKPKGAICTNTHGLKMPLPLPAQRPLRIRDRTKEGQPFARGPPSTMGILECRVEIPKAAELGSGTALPRLPNLLPKAFNRCFHTQHKSGTLSHQSQGSRHFDKDTWPHQ